MTKLKNTVKDAVKKPSNRGLMLKLKMTYKEYLDRVIGPVYLTTEKLAERWEVHPNTVERWRIQEKGPTYDSLGGDSIIRYSLSEIEAYEKAHRIKPAKQKS